MCQHNVPDRSQRVPANSDSAKVSSCRVLLTSTCLSVFGTTWTNMTHRPAIGGGTGNLLEQVCRRNHNCRNRSGVTSYGWQSVKNLVLPKTFAAGILAETHQELQYISFLSIYSFKASAGLPQPNENMSPASISSADW